MRTDCAIATTGIAGYRKAVQNSNLLEPSGSQLNMEKESSANASALKEIATKS